VEDVVVVIVDVVLVVVGVEVVVGSLLLSLEDFKSGERRALRSLFSFLASFNLFSKDSMCTLCSKFTDVSLVIFCKRSWFSVINPFVLISRSLMYSFLR